MGFWIHVEELPTRGGGDSPKFGCLACFALVAVPLFLWYVYAEYGLTHALVRILAMVLLAGSIASVFGIIYILTVVRFARPVILSGVAGFVAWTVLFLIRGVAFPGCIIFAPIGAIAAMCLYVRFF